MIDKLKGAIKSLTIWFNSIIASTLVGLPLAQDTFPQLQPYIPANAYKYGMAALIIGNILLRFRTSKPLGGK